MNAPKLIFDCHLDISMNAMEFNRDQRWTWRISGDVS